MQGIKVRIHCFYLKQGNLCDKRVPQLLNYSHEVPKKRSVDEPKIILEALNKTDWNKAKAARPHTLSKNRRIQTHQPHRITVNFTHM